VCALISVLTNGTMAFFFFFSRQGQRAVCLAGAQRAHPNLRSPLLMGNSVFFRTLPPDVLAEIGLTTLLSCWRTQRTPGPGLSRLAGQVLALPTPVHAIVVWDSRRTS
jgi:hypothetical protein